MKELGKIFKVKSCVFSRLDYCDGLVTGLGDK